MKELLYIPSGLYYRFNGGKTPFEKFQKRLDDSLWWSDEELIQFVCRKHWQSENYKRAGIDVTKPIYPYEFELVDI